MNLFWKYPKNSRKNNTRRAIDAENFWLVSREWLVESSEFRDVGEFSEISENSLFPLNSLIFLNPLTPLPPPYQIPSPPPKESNGRRRFEQSKRGEIGTKTKGFRE